MTRLVILNPTCLDVLDAHRDYLDSVGVRWVADPVRASARLAAPDGPDRGFDP